MDSSPCSQGSQGWARQRCQGTEPGSSQRPARASCRRFGVFGVVSSLGDPCLVWEYPWDGLHPSADESQPQLRFPKSFRGFQQLSKGILWGMESLPSSAPMEGAPSPRPLLSPRASPAPSPQKQELPLGICSGPRGHFKVNPLLETTLMCWFFIGKQKSRRAVPSSWHNPIPNSLFQDTAPSWWNWEQPRMEKRQELPSHRHAGLRAELGQAHGWGCSVLSHLEQGFTAWQGRGSRASSSTPPEKPQNAGI